MLNKMVDMCESKCGLFFVFIVILYIFICWGFVVLLSIVNVKFELNVGARKLGFVDLLCDFLYLFLWCRIFMLCELWFIDVELLVFMVLMIFVFFFDTSISRYVYYIFDFCFFVFLWLFVVVLFRIFVCVRIFLR